MSRETITIDILFFWVVLLITINITYNKTITKANNGVYNVTSHAMLGHLNNNYNVNFITLSNYNYSTSND